MPASKYANVCVNFLPIPESPSIDVIHSETSRSSVMGIFAKCTSPCRETRHAEEDGHNNSLALIKSLISTLVKVVRGYHCNI